MGFTEILRRIVDEEKDALCVAIVGTDGIVVEERLVDSQIDLASVGAEYSSILKDISKVSDSLRFGDVKEVVVFTDKAIVMLKGINKEYFILFAIKPDGNIGKGRFLLRREMTKLEKELQ